MKTLVLFGMTLLVCSALLELGSRAFIYFKIGSVKSAKTLFEEHVDSNQFIVRSLAGTENCNYSDTLFPHPYLAFVYHKNPPCGSPRLNNIGLIGQDFPLEKRSDRFTILLTGGSVAFQLAEELSGNVPYLETVLNEQYISPSGKPFMVLNGAAGAWKQPLQTIIFLLHLETLDGIITLDGFNEHYQLRAKTRFDFPSLTNFESVNPLTTGNFKNVIGQWMVGKLYRKIKNHPVLANSHAVYLSMRAVEHATFTLLPKNEEPATTTQKLFLSPSNWDVERREIESLKSYEKYINAIDSLAKSSNIAYSHFLQPVPAIDKPLTEEEKSVVGTLNYKADILKIEKNLFTQRSSKNRVSLLSLFKDQNQTIYADQIHCKWETNGHSPGYRLMAEEIAKRLATLWKLKKR